MQKLYNFLVVKFCILRQGTGALQTHFFRSILHKTFYLNVSTTFSTLCWRYTMESHFWFVINHDDLVFNSSFMLKREVLTNHLEFQSNGKWIFNFMMRNVEKKLRHSRAFVVWIPLERWANSIVKGFFGFRFKFMTVQKNFSFHVFFFLLLDSKKNKLKWFII